MSSILLVIAQSRRMRTKPRDGTLVKLLPFHAVLEVCPMKPEQIPNYAADGTSLGFRALAAAKRLIAGGFVTPSYGRKGHLKAIWLRREDGSNPVEARARSGTRYSFLENLESGPVLEASPLGSEGRGWRGFLHARRLRSSSHGLFGPLKQRKKQIGGRYLARVRGAFGKLRILQRGGGLQCVRNAAAIK